jgi:hypothetical protein
MAKECSLQYEQQIQYAQTEARRVQVGALPGRCSDKVIEQTQDKKP